jgi:hypothetical protein
MRSYFLNTLLTSMATEEKSIAIITDSREGYVFIAYVRSISFKMPILHFCSGDTEHSKLLGCYTVHSLTIRLRINFQLPFNNIKWLSEISRHWQAKG